jgi:hypothetical protein
MADKAQSQASDPQENTFSQLRCWIEDCGRLHPACQPSGSPAFIPPRLLDLSNLRDDKGRVRLVLTSSLATAPAPQRYLALSYCWGDGGASCKTTRSNLASRLKGFKLSSLPATHKHHIRIAQQLGVQYVWIDSLCMLQDSTQDWERESAAIELIYANAYCTVSALEPNNANAGIFRSQPLTTAGEDSEEPEPSEATAKVDLSAWKERFRTAALNKRGWTVQERELSTRIVHFFGDEMLWECRTAQATWSSPRLQLKTFLGQYFRILDASSVKAPNKHSIQASWRRMVEDYTSRSLKSPDDRLRALSGIASMVKQQIGCDYIAGLWTASLVDDLHWITTGAKQPYPEEGRAPSWSWAAFDCPIKFITHGVAGSPYNTFMGPTLEGYEPGNLGEFADGTHIQPSIRMTCRLKEVKVENGKIVEYVTGAQAGRWPHVLYNAVVVRSWPEGFQGGFLRQGHIEFDKATELYRQEMGWVDMDSSSNTGKGQRLFCMYLSFAPGAWYGECYSNCSALVLTPTDLEKLEFRRVGLSGGTILPWWADSHVSPITIV